jgi:hypothetical protein
MAINKRGSAPSMVSLTSRLLDQERIKALSRASVPLLACPISRE